MRDITESAGRSAAASLPWVSADEVFTRVSYEAAVRAIQTELRDGLDPADDFPRSTVKVRDGQLLLMPSQSAQFVGVKVASVAPGNPALGKERIQGIYLLLDAATLSPLLLLDGVALTTLRTPAVSAAVAQYLAPAVIEHAVVFGSGPQAWGHVRALRTVRSLSRVTIVGRNQERAAALARRVTDIGIDSRIGSADAVADAQLIVCATTARTPLFDGNLVPVDCCVIAVGSHEPDARELDSALLARSQLVVEDPATAVREAGDVIIAIREGSVDATKLLPMRDIITGAVTADRSRPRVFKSSGMAWEDLVIASAIAASDSSTR